jgi:[ribosomal protein S5]-alanine N-acetyltransferase
MTVIFETPRLLLRQFTINDADLILLLNIDPEVTKFTHDPVSTLEKAEEVLVASILPQYALYNHGRWAVHIRKDLRFIGWCGLKYREQLKEIDLGYRFLKESWGKGYATEAAYGSIKYGFEKLNMRRIVGRAEPGNIASIRVLEKCGMRYVGEEMVEGHKARTYDIISPFIR